MIIPFIIIWIPRWSLLICVDLELVLSFNWFKLFQGRVTSQLTKISKIPQQSLLDFSGFSNVFHKHRLFFISLVHKSFYKILYRKYYKEMVTVITWFNPFFQNILPKSKKSKRFRKHVFNAFQPFTCFLYV